MKVQDVMTRDPACVTPSASIREAARLMQREDTGVVPVVEGEGATRRLVGLITDRDIAIRAVAEGRDANTRVSEVMTANRLATCSPDDDIDSVMNAMAKEQVRRIPIVDERGSLVGIVAQADIVRKANDERKAEHTIEAISQPGGKNQQ